MNISSRKGSVNLTVVVVVVGLAAVCLLVFGSSLGLWGKQVQKDGKEWLESGVSPEIYEQEAYKELDAVSGKIREQYVQKELANFELENREAKAKSLKDEITRKIPAFTRGAEFLKNSTPEDVYVDKNGKSHSYQEVIMSTNALRDGIAGLQKQLAMLTSRNRSLKSAIEKSEKLIAKKAIEVDSARDRLKSDVAELQMLKEINKMRVNLGEPVLDNLEIPVFNAINKQLAEERAKAKYHDNVVDRQESKNFLEEDDFTTDLEAIIEFEASLK